MKVEIITKHGDPYPPEFNLKKEEEFLENLFKKGIRPIKGDFFADEEGNSFKINWICFRTIDKVAIAISI